MLALFSCNGVVSAYPSVYWIETADTTYGFNGIKWQGNEVKGTAYFNVTLNRQWQVGTNKVGAKGPDTKLGWIAGPSTILLNPSLPVVGGINSLLLHNSQTLFINEFVAAEAGTLAEPDWIEIHNKGKIPMDLQGYLPY